MELHDQPTELTELEVQELVRWKSTVLDALAGATEGGLPIDDAGVIAEKLSQCAACKTVLYCSRACQASHWKLGHKAACRAAVAARGGA